jgi:methylase of polypeptide subunit release factors
LRLAGDAVDADRWIVPVPDGSHPLVSRFGDALRQAGYSEAGLRQAVGTSSSLTHDPRAIDVARRRLPSGTALDTLIKLFCLGLPMPTDELTHAVGRTTADHLARIGVVTHERESTIPLMAIDAVDDLLIAHDPARRGAPLPGDHVIGLGPAPRTLAALTVRSRARRVLDLGTGSGIHALLALNHCDQVVATDINPKALAYTHFNAALNRLAMPTIRQGDLFQPVADEAFDLIVANPPYVLSPDSSLHFRDSGMVGDDLSHTVVREAARHLNDGAFASILVTWAHREGESWAEPLAGWVRGVGCDALLLHFRTYDPLTYASLWIKEEADFAGTLDRWLAYYRRLGIRAMSSGAVILRRRAGVNWMRSAKVLAAPIQNASDHLLRIFDANDRLSCMPDAEVLEQRFRPHPGHRIHRTGVSGGRSYLVEGQYLETTAGIPLRVSLGELGSRLLRQCDGTRSLRTLTAQLTEMVPHMTSGDVTRGALRIVKQLLALGFLEIDGPALDPRAFIDIESAHRKERSLVTS